MECDRGLHTTIETALYRHRMGQERKKLVGEASNRIRTLQGLLPISSHRKKVHDDGDTGNRSNLTPQSIPMCSSAMEYVRNV